MVLWLKNWYFQFPAKSRPSHGTPIYFKPTTFYTGIAHKLFSRDVIYFQKFGIPLFSYQSQLKQASIWTSSMTYVNYKTRNFFIVYCSGLWHYEVVSMDTNTEINSAYAFRTDPAHMTVKLSKMLISTNKNTQMGQVTLFHRPPELTSLYFQYLGYKRSAGNITNTNLRHMLLLKSLVSIRTWNTKWLLYTCCTLRCTGVLISP